MGRISSRRRISGSSFGDGWVKPVLRLSWVVGGSAVEVMATQSYGPDTAEVR